MIKIKTPGCERIYDSLLEDEVERSIEEEFDYLDGEVNYSLVNIGPVELPDPLESITMSFVKGKNKYSSFVDIVPRDVECFKGKSKKLQSILNKKGYKFVPTSKDMTGYIMRPSKNIQTPIAAFFFDVDEYLSFRCAYGQGGAETPFWDTRSAFKRETVRLNDYSNAILETIYGDKSLKKVLGNYTSEVHLKYPTF